LDQRFRVYTVQVLVNGNDHRSTSLGVTKPRHDRIDGIANVPRETSSPVQK
jgi:hypothetical protein